MCPPCTSLDQVVTDILAIVDGDKARSRDDNDGAEYFFRGEQRNHGHPGNPVLDTHFDSYLDRFESFWKHEDELYQEAMRLNVASFTEDRTMCERVARMQHYRLPTRFADLSVNAFLPTLFACGGCSDTPGGYPDDDGFIRVVKVARHKMKPIAIRNAVSIGGDSDTIAAISCLPLIEAWKINPSKKDGLGYLTYQVKKESPGFSSESEWGEIGETLRDDIQKVWAFKPLMNNPRIRNQGGLFLAFGCHDGKEPLHPTFSERDYTNPNAPSYGIAQVGFVRIAAAAKKTILDQLRMFGMTEEAVYPDLQNVCQTLDKRFRKLYPDK